MSRSRILALKHLKVCEISPLYFSQNMPSILRQPISWRLSGGTLDTRQLDVYYKRPTDGPSKVTERQKFAARKRRNVLPAQFIKGFDALDVSEDLTCAGTSSIC